MLYLINEESRSAGDSVTPFPKVGITGSQEIPDLTQDQWLRLVRMIMSVGDVEFFSCALDEPNDYAPVAYRTSDGRIELAPDGDFRDDD